MRDLGIAAPSQVPTEFSHVHKSGSIKKWDLKLDMLKQGQ